MSVFCIMVFAMQIRGGGIVSLRHGRNLKVSSRILVIDDDSGVREMLSDLFARAGYEVVTAENGKVGLDCYRRRRADLVITDIIMPEKEGLETIIDIRREDPDARIFAISGGSRNVPLHFLDACLKLGALSVFRKPFDCDELLSAARKLLDG